MMNKPPEGYDAVIGDSVSLEYEMLSFQYTLQVKTVHRFVLQFFKANAFKQAIVFRYVETGLLRLAGMFVSL